MDVAVDIPPDDSAAAVAGAPDDAVDVAIVPPDAYALLLDVAVAHLFAIAHASTDVAVAVSIGLSFLQPPSAVLVSCIGVYVFHSIVAGLGTAPVVPYVTSGSAGRRRPSSSCGTPTLAVMATGVSNKLIRARENFMMIDDD